MTWKSGQCMQATRSGERGASDSVSIQKRSQLVGLRYNSVSVARHSCSQLLGTSGTLTHRLYAELDICASCLLDLSGIDFVPVIMAVNCVPYAQTFDSDEALQQHKRNSLATAIS